MRLSAFMDTYSEPMFPIRIDDVKDHEAFVHSTFANLRKRVEYRIGRLPNREALLVFTKQTQTKFALVANDAFNHAKRMDTDATQNPMVSLFMEINNEMLTLLGYLHTYYKDCFDHSMKLPLGMKHDKPYVDELDTLMKWLGGVDDELTTLLSSFFKGETGEEVDWTMFDYQSELLERLGMLHWYNVHSEPKEALIEILISCNFNHVGFYQYMLHYIDTIASANTTFEEKKIDLAQLLNRIERIREEHDMAYDPQIESIRKSVCNCIKSEMEMLHRLHTTHTDLNNGASDGFYFGIAGTIQELLFFAWLMVEVKFIKTKTYSNLYAFIHRHIQTERTKNPSPQYMRNHFGKKHVSPKVVRKIRMWLMQMVSYIDKHFKDELTI